jgi:bifunctional DNase/RNase
MSLEMRVLGVVFDESNESPVVLLADLDDALTLPIYVGAAEAAAISLHLEGVDLGRPLTHDLLLASLAALGGHLEEVEVTEVRGGTFFATLRLEQGGVRIEVDARPSDAIALALRAGIPIRVSERVLDRGTILIPQAEGSLVFAAFQPTDNAGKRLS